MKVIFRVDASIEIGSGHVVRCLSLADEMKCRGYSTKFLTRDHDGQLAGLIEARGHSVSLLPAPLNEYQKQKDDVAHAGWLGVSWEEDAEQTEDVLGPAYPDLLVVDHYGIDARWHSLFKGKAGKIVVVDDLADRELSCDILIDQTFGRREEDYKDRVPASCQMLLGCDYALIKRKFSELRPDAIKKRNEFNGIKEILVSLGGMDFHNVTHSVLRNLEKFPWRQLPVVNVVQNSKSPNIKQIRQFANDSSLNISVLADIEDMPQRMLDADLGVGAGGGTAWERCCMGLPSLIISLAENQDQIAATLSRQGVAILVDRVNGEISSDMVGALNDLVEDASAWKRMSEESFKLVDGFGCRRVLSILDSPKAKDGNAIWLRSLLPDDEEIIYSWQSDPQTRLYSHNSTIPTKQEHHRWMNLKLEDYKGITNIIMHGNEPAGVVRADMIEDADKLAYLVSIYVSPEKYRLGIAKVALEELEYLVSPAELRAEILDENKASIELFSKSGYRKNDLMNAYIKQATAKQVTDRC